MTHENGRDAKAAESGEIRVTTLGRVASYVAYAKKLLEAGVPVISIRGTGRAMSNVVETAEVLKHTVKGLHQVTHVDTVTNTDPKPPRELKPSKDDAKEEEEKEQRGRSVCFLIVSLSKDPSLLDTNALGYQPPISDEALQAVDVESLVNALKGASFRRRLGNKRPPQTGQGAQATRTGGASAANAAKA